MKWERLEPGVYVSSDGELRLVVGELLRAHGHADTRANRARVAAAAEREIRRLHPDAHVVTTEDPPPRRFVAKDRR